MKIMSVCGSGRTLPLSTSFGASLRVTPQAKEAIMYNIELNRNFAKRAKAKETYMDTINCTNKKLKDRYPIGGNITLDVLQKGTNSSSPFADAKNNTMLEMRLYDKKVNYVYNHELNAEEQSTHLYNVYNYLKSLIPKGKQR